MRAGVWKRLIGYPVFCFAAYFGGCYLFANAYVRPPRDVPSTPQTLTNVAVPTAAGPDPAWVTAGLNFAHPTSKVVFVMAHGYGGNRAAWRGVIEKLKLEGYEAVVPCMPGQDASPDPKVGFGLKEARVIVDTVKWVRSRYPVEHPPKVVLLGVSMGGAASWLASDMAPDQVDAVVTEGAFARFDQTLDHWFDQFFPCGSFVMKPVIFFARRIANVDPTTIRPDLAAAHWRKPALVIQGAQDSVLPKYNADQLSTAAKCPLWMVPHANHARCYLADEKGYMEHLTAIAKRVQG